MLSMGLMQAADALGAKVVGDDVSFSSVSTDTRTLQGSPLFVALRGERFDGHDYLSQAAENGAVAVMVDQAADIDIPQLVVEDTRLALGALSAVWRDHSETTVVAVTGSNGKTTLKEMLKAILLVDGGEVLATEGNLNNDIGLPLTLLRLQNEPRAVVEMGANHPGEISYLSKLGKPDVAVLNNAGRAHLEGFGSPEGVARAKVEIVDGLKDDGWFVYNADSPWVDLWRQITQGRKRISFGTCSDAEIYSRPGGAGTVWTDQGFVNRFEVESSVGKFEIELKLAGEHNRMNALAATAVAICLGVSVDVIKTGLASLQPVKGRLLAEVVDGIYVIDDSYNANPDSVEAAIDVLQSANGKRFLVLGDLAELGEDAAEMHQKLGEIAKTSGIESLYAVGVLSVQAVEGFGEGGIHFSDQAQLIEKLKNELNDGDAVLVKGSRSAGMDRVVDALANRG